MSRNARAFAVVLLAASCVSGPAHAHSQFAGFIPFWSGVLHFLVSPLAVAAVLGLVASLAASREESMLWSACIAGMLAMVGARLGLGSIALLAPAGAVLAGLAAASGWALNWWLAILLAAVAGASAGSATALDVPNWPTAMGVAFAVTYIGLSGIAYLWAIEAKPRLKIPFGIGRRIVGAWVAAIGLLLGTLALKGIGSI
ncbi:MAG TPA: hypothetical protein VI279_14080 [Rhodocyclaceae bacterium]